MKTLLGSIAIVLCLVALAFSQVSSKGVTMYGIAGMVGDSVISCEGALDSVGTAQSTWLSYVAHRDGSLKTHTIPGSGSRRLCSLSGSFRVDSGEYGFSVALYDSDGDLIAESEEITSTSIATWVHFDHTQIRPPGGSYGDQVLVTGGSTVRLVVSTRTITAGTRYVAGGAEGDSGTGIQISATSYDENVVWPTTIPAGDTNRTRAPSSAIKVK